MYILIDKTAIFICSFILLRSVDRDWSSDVCSSDLCAWLHLRFPA